MTDKKPTVLRSQEIMFYRTPNHNDVRIEILLKDENVWMPQARIAELFEVDRSVVTKHIRNIFKDEELVEEAVCAKFAHTAEDGKTYQTKFYNLDMIIAKAFAEEEFAKYQVIRDRTYQSDFDRLLEKTEH